MNRQRWLVLSSGLNVLLAGVVVWAARMQPGTVPAPVLTPITNRVIRTPQVIHEPPASTIVIQASFNWSQIESTDYRVYMENLRGIGCPETTIRDIIVADLDEWLARRIREMVDAEMGRYWDNVINTNREERIRAGEQWSAKLNSYKRERSEILKVLFNDSDVEFKLGEAKDRAEAVASYRYWFDFLSKDKLERIIEIKDRYRELSYRLQIQFSLLAPDEHKKQGTELTAQEEQEIQNQLSSQELEEYTLRKKRPGGQAGKLDLTEDEARELARIGTSPEDKDRIKELLGPERFAEFERPRDLAYESTAKFTEHFGLPEETAARVTQLWHEASAQADQIRTDQSRSAEERQLSLDALQAATRNAVAAELGPEMFKLYQKHKGDWLSGLANVAR